MSDNGLLDAALANSLLGTARGKVHSNLLAGGIKAWMAMFTYSEQFNRRVTALSAFRLFYRRALAEGMDQEVAYAHALKQSEKAVVKSQGDYGAFNRPSMARGNLLQYTFMFKTHQIVTVQHLSLIHI